VQENFPFPFSVVSVDVSWFMATWFEIVGAFALVLNGAGKLSLDHLFGRRLLPAAPASSQRGCSPGVARCLAAGTVLPVDFQLAPAIEIRTISVVSDR
jgi:hypothetical protein